jgi:Circadian oscillating protein COP23
MKIKYLYTLLATGAISLAAYPAIAESADAPQLNFACQMNEGIPTTVAQDPKSGKTLPIFTWKQEALSHIASDTPQQLCENVTSKLQMQSENGYDLSQITFFGTQQADLPTVCASVGKTCSTVLFTLRATEDPANDAQDVVVAILNPNLQENKIVYTDRGVQSTSYQVNFWDLFNFAPKTSFK